MVVTAVARVVEEGVEKVAAKVVVGVEVMEEEEVA